MKNVLDTGGGGVFELGCIGVIPNPAGDVGADNEGNPVGPEGNPDGVRLA